MYHPVLDLKLPPVCRSFFPVFLRLVLTVPPLFCSFFLLFGRFRTLKIYVLEGGVSVRQPYTGTFRYTVSTVSVASPDAKPWLLAFVTRSTLLSKKSFSLV